MPDTPNENYLNVLVHSMKRIETLIIRMSVWSFLLGGIMAFILVDAGLPFPYKTIGLAVGALAYYALLRLTRPLKHLKEPRGGQVPEWDPRPKGGHIG